MKFVSIILLCLQTGPGVGCTVETEIHETLSKCRIHLAERSAELSPKYMLVNKHYRMECIGFKPDMVS